MALVPLRNRRVRVGHRDTRPQHDGYLHRPLSPHLRLARNEYTEGLVGVYAMDTERPSVYVPGQSPESGSAGFGRYKRIVGRVTTSGNIIDFNNLHLALQGKPACTIILAWRNWVPNAWIRYLAYNSDLNNRLRVMGGSPTSNLYWQVANGGNLRTALVTFPNGVDYQPVIFGGVFDGTKSANDDIMKVFLNGNRRSVTHSNTDTVTSVSPSLGALTAELNDGVYTRLYVWDRSLADSKVETIQRNMDILFEPVRNTLYVPSVEAVTPIQTNTSLFWDLRERIGNNASLFYSLLNAVQNDTDLLYSLLNAVGNNANALYSVLESVDNNVSAAWSVIEGINSSAPISWDVQSALTAIQSNSTLVWAIREAVGNSENFVWDVLNTLSNQGQIKWSLLNASSNSTGIQWDLQSSLSAAQNSSAINWDVIAAVATQVEARWDIFESLGASSSLKWSIASAVVSAISSSWDILNGVQTNIGISWDSVEIVGNTVNIVWRINSENVLTPINPIVVSVTPETSVVSVTPIRRVH